MKTIHLTDVHLTCPGEQIYGLDPRTRLDAAVAELKGKAEHPLAHRQARLDLVDQQGGAFDHPAGAAAGAEAALFVT